MMMPGQVYAVTIDIFPTSNLFKRGHRVRLDISSSNFPRFDVNPNTGEPQGRARGTRVARNAVHVGPACPSQVILPVIPRAPQRTRARPRSHDTSQAGPRRAPSAAEPEVAAGRPHHSAEDNPALQAIWHVVCAIPRGRVTTYGAVARAAGLPGRARQAGFALRVAPRALNLPWHRVVGAGGRIVFPKSSRQHLEQARRLRAEGVVVRDGRVRHSSAC